MIRVTCACGHVQTLPDKLGGKFARCPGCRGTVAVPEAAAEVEEAPAPGKGALELDSKFLQSPLHGKPAAAPVAKGGGAEPAGIPCPRCGTAYAADKIFCPKCAVVLATGAPVAGLVPGGASAPRASGGAGTAWVKWVLIGLGILVIAIAAAKALR